MGACACQSFVVWCALLRARLAARCGMLPVLVLAVYVIETRGEALQM